MPDTISNIDILIIRQCKANINIPSIPKLKKLVARRHALSYSYVGDADLIVVLTEIVLDYGLVRDMYEFIAVDLNPNSWRNKMLGIEPTYDENLIDHLVSKIRGSMVNKFPRYIAPRRYRNKYND